MQRLKKGVVIAGKYLLKRRLASGGMGAVWLGQHLSLDIPIAIKFVEADLLARAEERWTTRFEIEAKAAAKLRHPQVVQVFDHGIEDGVPFIVMELLEGEDLGKHLGRVGPLALEEVAALAIEIARPLGRAHELGIVHRDLKPGNIFLAQSGDETVVKILDFGIAKAPVEASALESTGSNDLLGSPTYMSPEQAIGARDVDHRTDLWAFGVIVFRALTANVPFEGTVGRVLVDLCTKPPRSARDFVPGLPESVDAFFDRAFAQEPADRFQSARELAQAFAAIAGVSMPKPSLPVMLAPPLDGASEETTAPTRVVEPTTLSATLSKVTTRRAPPMLWWSLPVAATVIAIVIALASSEPAEGEARQDPPPTVDAAPSVAPTTVKPAPAPPPAAASGERPAPTQRTRVVPPKAIPSATASSKPERPISEFGY